MQDIFQGLMKWDEEGRVYALATVTRTWGSAPRMVGASMAISQEQDILGSVSGGCIEGAVIRAANEIMQSGVSQHLSFGVSNEDAWAVGLSCGGKVDVFVEKGISGKGPQAEQDIWKSLEEVHRHHLGAVLVSKIDAEQREHALILSDGKVVGKEVGEELYQQAMLAFKQRKSQIITLGEESYFAWVFPRRSQLIIIGAAHITVDLVDLADKFNFETVVIDPRGIFTDHTQFLTKPSQLHNAWPEEVLNNFTYDPYTYVVVLTHDPKIDDQALHILLKTEVAYIGALGSKRTHAKRVKRLQEEGVSEEEIERIKGPIGIDINAKRPREIALSIIAEMIQEQNRYL